MPNYGCQRSQRLRGHCVSVVNNYADIVSGNYFTLEKVKKTHKKVVNVTTLTRCQRSQRLRGHCVSVVNDYAKTKKFAKPFLPVHMGLRSNLLSQKNVKKSCDTVPLRQTFCTVSMYIVQCIKSTTFSVITGIKIQYPTSLHHLLY